MENLADTNQVIIDTGHVRYENGSGRVIDEPLCDGWWYSAPQRTRTILSKDEGETLLIWNFQTADVYEPIGEETDQAFFLRDSYWGMNAIGLLKPGVTLAQARDDMKRVNAALADAYPNVDGNIKANIMTLKDEMVGDMRPALRCCWARSDLYC